MHSEIHDQKQNHLDDLMEKTLNNTINESTSSLSGPIKETNKDSDDLKKNNNHQNSESNISIGNKEMTQNLSYLIFFSKDFIKKYF